MSAGAATLDAGVRMAVCAAPKSMITDSSRTMPRKGRPWRSKVPSLNGVGASWAAGRTPAQSAAAAIAVTKRVIQGPPG
jgi:hypothetical protein